LRWLMLGPNLNNNPPKNNNNKIPQIKPAQVIPNARPNLVTLQLAAPK
jgi:hypothetical protein